MKNIVSFILTLIILNACQEMKGKSNSQTVFTTKNPITSVDKLEKPIGFQSVETDKYGTYFQNFALKLDSDGEQVIEVYDINNHYRGSYPYLLDIDLLRFQECADLSMRMHIQSQAKRGKTSSIHSYEDVFRFSANQPSKQELINLFQYANSFTIVQHDLKSISIKNIQPGDVLAIGGNPGHVVIIMNVIVNDEDEKKFCLAQSWLPARMPHFLINLDTENDIWFDLKKVKEKGVLRIDGYEFGLNDFYRYKEREQ